MLVNIVMGVYGRPELTAQALRTIVDTEVPFTLNLVDDGSDPPFLEQLLGSLDFSGSIAVTRVPHQGIVGRVRNLGAELVGERGDYLYFSDNDVFFTANWLEWLTSAYDSAVNDGFRLLGGCRHPYHGINKRYILDGLFDVGETNEVVGASHLMRWEVWDRFGPYPANAVGTNQSEDVALCRRITEAGFKVGSIEPSVVHHCGLTDSFGRPAVGIEVIPRYFGILQQ